MQQVHVKFVNVVDRLADKFSFPNDIDENEAFGLCYTSGTTGKTKEILVFLMIFIRESEGCLVFTPINSTCMYEHIALDGSCLLYIGSLCSFYGGHICYFGT
jgi:hypothetical protein